MPPKRKGGGVRQRLRLDEPPVPVVEDTSETIDGFARAKYKTGSFSHHDILKLSKLDPSTKLRTKARWVFHERFENQPVRNHFGSSSAHFG